MKSIFDYIFTALKYSNSELHDVLFRFVKNKIIGAAIIKL